MLHRSDGQVQGALRDSFLEGAAQSLQLLYQSSQLGHILTWALDGDSRREIKPTKPGGLRCLVASVQQDTKLHHHSVEMAPENADLRVQHYHRCLMELGLKPVTTSLGLRRACLCSDRPLYHHVCTTTSFLELITEGGPDPLQLGLEGDPCVVNLARHVHAGGSNALTRLLLGCGYPLVGDCNIGRLLADTLLLMLKILLLAGETRLLVGDL